MTLTIVITCILANGQQVHPRGQYTAWAPCNKYVEHFQTKLYPSIDGRHPLCWCHKAPRAASMPVPERRDDDDEDYERKAPW